ncbi:MAG: J domain-containing protein [Rickettsiales bacterium]|jgi:DnaJ-domain-containing protein 1|nr:J domain-containing protein [Rickettsiales bacterium]
MIKKCDFPNCEKAGKCRAPKTRELREYWHFCQEHAAEYNKNWNFYADMTTQEIEKDWEKQTFGDELKDKTKASADTADYVKFLNDFINGRSAFDKVASRKTLPGAVVAAFATFNLPITASWNEVQKAYRAAAKLHHPDTAKNKTIRGQRAAAAEFSKITNARTVLENYFKK